MDDYLPESRPVFEWLGEPLERLEDGGLSIFASDNEDVFLLNQMSVIKPAESFRPLELGAPVDPAVDREDDPEERGLHRIAREGIERRRQHDQRLPSKFVVDGGGVQPRCESKRSEQTRSDWTSNYGAAFRLAS